MFKNRSKIYKGKDFEWSKDCWTHNVFRAFESIFGRKNGIRFEGLTAIENGKEYHVFGTYENMIAFGEGQIRKFLKSLDFKFVRVPSYQLVSPEGFSWGSIPSYKFAVAFDNAQANTGSATLSCTVSGSNRMLFGSFAATSNAGLAATFDSVSMTVQNVQIQTGFYIAGAYLANPNSGTHNFVGTGVYIGTVASSYSGVAQNAPDVSTTATSGATTVTATVNTAITGCWMSMFAVGNNGTPNASTNATARSQNSSPATPSAFDSNGTITTGGFSMTVNNFSPQQVGAVAYAFAPSASGPAGVKTFNGLALGSVKTINSLATASVKSINGLV